MAIVDSFMCRGQLLFIFNGQAVETQKGAAPGKQRYTFLAAGKGRAVLTFIYR